MKVTALIPDELVSEVRELTQGKNITESLIIALDEWVVAQKQKKLELSEFVGIWKNREISKASILLISKYSKSHCLDIPDSLIVATCMVTNCKLYTLNHKDFKYIGGLKLL